MVIYKGSPMTGKRDFIEVARGFDDSFGDVIEEFLTEEAETSEEQHFDDLYEEETKIFEFLTGKLSAEDLEEVRKIMVMI